MLSDSERIVDAEDRNVGRTRLLLLLPVVIFVALATIFLYRIMAGGDISQVPSVLINKPVPQMTLSALKGLGENGNQVPGLATADLGGEVTLVNVFASWCVPCRQEHPLLIELSKQDDLRIVGINQKDQPDNALEFLNALGNPYDRVGVDRDGRASIEWGVYGVPETFVVDKAGCIRQKHIGPLNERAIAESIGPVVAALKAEDASASACAEEAAGAAG